MQQIILSTEVEFSVEVEDIHGCKDTEKLEIDFFNANNCHIIAEDVVMCEGDTKEIDVVFNTPDASVISCDIEQNISGITVIYDTSILSSNKTLTIIASNDGVSFLNLIFTDGNGCTAEKEIMVTVLKKPNSPNLNIMNDTICSENPLVVNILQTLDVYPAKLSYIVNNNPSTAASISIFDAGINSFTIPFGSFEKDLQNNIRFTSISDDENNCQTNINNLSFNFFVTDLEGNISSLSLTSSQFCETDQIEISYDGPLVTGTNRN